MKMVHQMFGTGLCKSYFGGLSLTVWEFRSGLLVSLDSGPLMLLSNSLSLAVVSGLLALVG